MGYFATCVRSTMLYVVCSILEYVVINVEIQPRGVAVARRLWQQPTAPLTFTSSFLDDVGRKLRVECRQETGLKQANQVIKRVSVLHRKWHMCLLFVSNYYINIHQQMYKTWKDIFSKAVYVRLSMSVYLTGLTLLKYFVLVALFWKPMPEVFCLPLSQLDRLSATGALSAHFIGNGASLKGNRYGCGRGSTCYSTGAKWRSEANTFTN